MDNNNIIITIGRQIGSGGSAIAKMLAKEFDARLYDKEILNLAARESGFCEEFFEENDEKKGFFKTALQFHFPLFTRNSYYNTDFNQCRLYPGFVSQSFMASSFMCMKVASLSVFE